MERTESSSPEAAAITKRRITKPGGFTIPGIKTKNGRGQTMEVSEGDEVTLQMRKQWDAWQKEANEEKSINIDEYSS